MKGNLEMTEIPMIEPEILTSSELLELPDEILHLYEFIVYDNLPPEDKRELHEIFSVEFARSYYNERGRRFSLSHG